MTREEHIAQAKRLVQEIRAKTPEQLEFESLLDKSSDLGANWEDRFAMASEIMEDFTDRFFEPVSLTRADEWIAQATIGTQDIEARHERAEIALLKVWIRVAELYKPAKKAADDNTNSEAV